MKTKGNNKSSKVKDFIVAIIVIMLFFPFVYAYYKDYKEKTKSSHKHSYKQATYEEGILREQDSVILSTCHPEYSEWYYEGYEKGYAAGEEDTNDGEYRAGYENSNPYTGKKAADFCTGYEHGYEDAFEEIIETSDEDGDAEAIW